MVKSASFAILLAHIFYTKTGNSYIEVFRLDHLHRMGVLWWWSLAARQDLARRNHDRDE